MAHYNDLEACNYFGKDNAHLLRAVGWLSHGKDFQVGSVDSSMFDKLKQLLIDPFQPMMFMGVHECELCQFDGPIGHANLFVPNGSTIFVCPELIVHYIAAHRYRPPDEFVDAVAQCPNTHTMEYKKLFLNSGGRPLVSMSKKITTHDRSSC